MNVGILGASGNVGRAVMRRLLSRGRDEVERVVLINRRVLDEGLWPCDERVASHVVDMASAQALQDACAPILAGVDVVVSTMGIGSGKGSVEQFRKVEVELPSAFARAAARAGVRRAVLLTGVGADVDSKSSWMVGGAAGGKFFHFKGLVEKNFAEAGFAEGLAIVRPAGLLGTSHVPAWLEWLLPRLDWMAPARFRCIHIDKLAGVMAGVAVDATSLASLEGAGGSGGLVVLEGQTLLALVSGDRRLAGA